MGTTLLAAPGMKLHSSYQFTVRVAVAEELLFGYVIVML